MTDGLTQPTRPLPRPAGGDLVDPFAPSQPRPVVGPPLPVQRSLSERQAETISEAVRPFRTDPGTMRFTRSPNPEFIRVNGQDVSRASVREKAAGGEQWAMQALRLVPEQAPAAPAAPETTPRPPKVPTPGMAPGMAPGAPAMRPAPRARPAQLVRVAGPTTTVTEGRTPAAQAATALRVAPGGTMEKLAEARITEQQLAALQMEDRIKAQEIVVNVKEQQRLRQADLNARRATKMKELQTKEEQLLEQANAMEIKDFWADKSTGSKILAAIGLTLGAFGSAAGGGPNTALQIINKAIDQDLLVQKANMAKGRARLEDLAGFRARVAQEFADEQTGDNVYYVAAMDRVISDMETLEMNAKTDAMVQSLQTIKAEAEDQRAAYLESMLGINRIRTQQTEATKYIPGTTPAQAAGMQKYDKKTFIPYLQGNARGGPGNVQKLLEFSRDAQQIMKAYNEMLDFRAKMGNFTDVQARAKIDRLNKRLVVIKKLKAQMGAAMTENEEKLITIKDPQAFRNFTAEAEIQQMKNDLITEIEANKDTMIFAVDPTTIPEVERRGSPVEAETIVGLEAR